MADAYFFTRADLDKIQALLDAEKRRVRNTTGRPGPEDEGYLPPEVYVAKTPSGGIGPLVNEDDTGTGTGTGTADEPGYADCDIYRVLRDTDNRWKLRRATAVSRRVYNLGSTAVTGSTWVLILRDKMGQWYVSQGGGSNKRLARLTGKRYLGYVPIYSGEFIDQVGNPPAGPGTGEYFGIPNIDIYTGTGADIDTGTGTGTTVTGESILDMLPCYHVRDIDVPVPWVTEVWRGEGPYYLFDGEPRWEMVERIGEFDPVTKRATGFLLRYDQNDKTSKRMDPIWIRNYPAPGQ